MYGTCCLLSDLKFALYFTAKKLAANDLARGVNVPPDFFRKKRTRGMMGVRDWCVSEQVENIGTLMRRVRDLVFSA